MRVGSHDAEVQCHGEREAAADAKTFNGSNRDLHHFLPSPGQTRAELQMAPQTPNIHGPARAPFGVFQVKAALSAFALPVRTTADVSPSSLCGS